MYINDDNLSDISKALLYDIAYFFQYVDEYITWDTINNAEVNEGIIERLEKLENKENKNVEEDKGL